MATAAVSNDNSNPQQGAFQTRRWGLPNRRDERKLFVGGLPANITALEFKTFFEQFGQVVDSVVMFDRETQRSRGFGFVTFEDPNVCRQLLMMGNDVADPSTAMSLVGRVDMQGKMCEVKAATPREGIRGRGRHEPKKMMQPYDGPAPDMYGYPPNGYPANMPPQAIYYPSPYLMPPGCIPYMEYPQPNGYAPFVEYPPPVPLAEEPPQTGAMIFPTPPYPIVTPHHMPVALPPLTCVPPGPMVPFPLIGTPLVACGMPPMEQYHHTGEETV